MDADVPQRPHLRRLTMANRWLDPLEWQRIKPWLFAVGSLMMALFQIQDLRRHEGWMLALDWLALVVFGAAVVVFAREGLRFERARRQGPRVDGAP